MFRNDGEPITFWSLNCLLFVLVGAFVATWPAFVFGPLLFPDTAPYVLRGEVAFNLLLEALGLEAEGGGANGGGGAIASGGGPVDGELPTPSEARTFRSPPYALFAYVGSLGNTSFTMLAIVQNAILMLAIWPLVAALRLDQTRLKRVAVLGALLVIAGTSLPWFGSFLMPDAFGGIVILYFAVLVSVFDRMDPFSRIVYALLAAFAVVTHYGNVPLAAACLVTALFLRAVQWRLTLSAIAFAVIPLGLAVMVNAGTSVAAGGSPSVAPKRIPILLARSIQDGPALKHLREHCDTYRYAICEVFPDEIPDNVEDILFADGSLRHQPVETMNRVRDEELTILWRAFTEYPVEQTVALTQNALLQLVLVDLDRLRVGQELVDEGVRWRIYQTGDPQVEVKAVFSGIHLTVYLLALFALALLAITRPSLRNAGTAMIAVVAVGLAANAGIFGGLSAPVGRYGARIAWVVVVIAVVLSIDRLREWSSQKDALRPSAVSPTA